MRVHQTFFSLFITLYLGRNIPDRTKWYTHAWWWKWIRRLRTCCRLHHRRKVSVLLHPPEVRVAWIGHPRTRWQILYQNQPLFSNQEIEVEFTSSSRSGSNNGRTGFHKSQHVSGYNTTPAKIHYYVMNREMLRHLFTCQSNLRRVTVGWSPR